MEDIRNLVDAGTAADGIETWNNPTQKRCGIVLYSDDGAAMHILISHEDANKVGWDLIRASQPEQ